ncbi:hypothetical protein CFIMG_007502RA00001 [Ceratocystis fimbriata CBS 114723]|uniref:Uncharacterized protein n=1 Tax=Ceratocystis fimbriata CBS 114723 TaxID=1035309 RepID=A0A2C5WWC9_9PEZI|nr:hypothetical protein CFIMG_007502RA00001 [Ceratocystis fimbriata CBS 114723]
MGFGKLLAILGQESRLLQGCCFTLGEIVIRQNQSVICLQADRVSVTEQMSVERPPEGGA